MAERRSPDYLTLAEAAVRLNISKSMVRRWIQIGLLSPTSAGGELQPRLSSSQVEALVPLSVTYAKSVREIDRDRERLNHPIPAEDKARRLATLDHLRRLNQEVLRSMGKELFTPSSTDLIHQARDERARERG